MNYIQEAFKRLNELGSAKKEAFTPFANGVGGWKELPTFKDVVEFGKGSKWVVARPDGEHYFDRYLKKYPGAVFVGREDPKAGKMLGMKLENGEIIDVFDEKDLPVKSFDMNLGETCEKGGEECKEGDEACKEECESCDEGFKDPIKYEGFTITATDDGKWLIDEWYEYYESKGAAMEAIDEYLKELSAKTQGEPKKD